MPVASWQDGPEYAPVERPAAFAAPDTAPLSRPEPRPAQAAAPADQPSGYEPPAQPVQPLREIAPATGPVRDPQLPFSVVSSVMTAGAWGSAHSAPMVTAPAPPPQPAWAPDQAFTSQYTPPVPAQGFPAPGTPAWFGPGTEFQRQQVQVPLTAGSVVQGATGGLLIVMVLAGVVPLLSPVLLVVGLTLTSMVRYRRTAVQTSFLVGLGLVLLNGLYGLVTGPDVSSAWDLMGGWSVAVAWVLTVVTISLQYVAIRDGEPPQR